MSLDNGYVTAEYLQKMAALMRSLKELSYEHMAITTGDTLLDVGCGPAVDTVPLAQCVGATGRVIGIDSDEGMLAQANEAAAVCEYAAIIEHRHGSALDLPLESNSVDSCRAERLLQVLPPVHEQQVVAELVRVTRPGGRIVLVDTDWGSASVDFSAAQLERRLMNFFTLQMRPNGLAGRRLHTLCREQGLEALRLDVVPMVIRRVADTPFCEWLTDTALGAGIINEEEARQWREELEARERQNTLYVCANMVVASGKKAG